MGGGLRGLIVTPLGIQPNMGSVLCFSHFLPAPPHPLSLATAFYFSSRWEAFRVLPLAESLTNVALKCNEVWNGSCGYNYPRTGAVTAMISLSLAIRISYGRGRTRGREWDVEIGWQAAIPRSYMSLWRQGRKQVAPSWEDGGFFSATELYLLLLDACAYSPFQLKWLSVAEWVSSRHKSEIIIKYLDSIATFQYD